MRSAVSVECRTKHCRNHTHNRGGLCNACLNRQEHALSVPSAAAERAARQPGAKLNLDWRNMREVG